MDILEEALAWAANGVPVFPCNTSKRPMTPNGHLDASTDASQVRSMFEGVGDCYIGGRMGKESGLFALDFDLYKGEEPQDFMDNLLAQGMLPQTRRHRTKSGGLHLLYQHDTEWPNLVPCSGVEIKGEGGYIILPPSEGYTVEREGLAYAPDSLITLLKTVRKTTASNTVDEYKLRIIQAEEFHDSIRQIVVKRAIQSWPTERILLELQECLAVSVARVDSHPRFDRWSALFNDVDKELTRMVLGGQAKFNPNTATEGMREAAFENKEVWGATAKVCGFLAAPTSPLEGETKPELDLLAEDWPYTEQDGYFASETCDILDQNYVVYPIFAENETTVLFAEPKMGKTAWNYTMNFYAACGMDFGESLKVVDQRPCIYFALEGSRAIQLRNEALKRQLTEDGVELPEFIPLTVITRPTNFLKEETRLEACNKIIAANNHWKKTMGVGLGIISIDTLTKAMASGDQNSVDDTSALFELVGLLRQAGVTASIVFVHHKARTGGVRGSTNIEAEPDVLLDVSKDKSDIVLTVARARSIEEGGRYVFGTKGYHLGTTSQGHNLNSFTVYPKDATSAPTASVAEALAESTALSTICSLGAGVHDLLSIFRLLKSSGIEPKSPNQRGRAKRNPSMGTGFVQEFFTGLVDEAMGRVFGTHALTLVMKDGLAEAVQVREM